MPKHERLVWKPRCATVAETRAAAAAVAGEAGAWGAGFEGLESCAGPIGETCVNAMTAQLVAAAEIHESRWCGKPLFIVGWKGNARRATCQVPSSPCVSSRNRTPRRQAGSVIGSSTSCASV